jgi:hypothetical protein
MRKLIWAVVAALTLYGGYWVAGSRAVLAGVEQALSEAKAAGQADYAAVSLAGFPSRFDLTVDRPAVVWNGGASGWAAPFLQIFALSYRPNRIIVVWPNEQTLTLAGTPLAVSTANFRASATFGASTDLPLDHSAVEIDAGKLTARAGWTLSFDSLRFGSRTAGSDTAHELGLSVTGLRTEEIDLPDAVAGYGAANARADVIVTFDGPLDRSAAVRPPLLLAADVTNVDITWGKAAVKANGRLEVTSAGFPEGRIETETTGWRDLLSLAAETGLIRPDLTPTAERMLDQLARASGSDNVLRLPLTFRGGWMSLGPLPLGPAPRLWPYLQ